MHVLVLPSFYPEKYKPLFCLFFQRQAVAVSRHVDKTGVVYVEQKSWRKIFNNFFADLYQKSVKYEDGILTYRRYGLSFFNQYEFGAKIWMLSTEKLVMDYINQNGSPDIIHAHNIFNAGRVALKINKELGIPFVVTEHSSSFLLNRITPREAKISREVIANAKSIIAVSSALAKGITSYVGECKVNVVPNVVDTELFKPVSPVFKDTYNFICVGNLLENKGQTLLIKAFNEAFPINANVRLNICGDGSEFSQIKALIEKFGRSEQIVLHGSLTPDKLAMVYQQSDCLVSPSYKETFGVVIIEAMASGLPVIATRSGGPEDIINDENGLLVETGSVAELSNALRFVFERKDRFDSEKIAAFVKEKYALSVIAEQIVSFYK